MSAPDSVVLFVHDSREERARAAQALGASARRVLVAEDVPTALAALSGLPTGTPAVVVSDVTLRGESGYTLGRRLKETSPAIAVVFLAGPEGERAAFQSGALALLSKPLNDDEANRFLAGTLADPASRSKLDAALASSRAGRADEAIAGLRGMVEAIPGSVLGGWAQYHLGILLHARGDAQGALEEWSALLEDDPRFWRAHVRLGAVFESKGEAAMAADHYRRALVENATLPAIRARAEALARSAATPEPTGLAPTRPATPVAESEGDSDTTIDEAAAGNGSDGAHPARTILVADDSELALEMIRDVLAKAGYRVVTAPDGKKALELARLERPDLMILDGLMPGATGFDVCKEVKETMYPGNAPKVVILSAIYTKQRQKSEAMELYKADDVLAKPFDDAEFIATIRKHVGD